MGPASEVRATGQLAGTGLAAVSRLIRDTHLGIAGRAFGLTGPGAVPARVIHDAVSRSVYAGVGGGLRVAATAAGHVAARRAARRPSYRPLTDLRRAAAVVAAVNGAWGDHLHSKANPLALRMEIRERGTTVPPTAAGLRAAYPDATDDVVVFLHGLCESDLSWQLGAVRHYGDQRSTHGSRLAAEHGSTPVFLRYNTGRHICDNGADLDRLLSALVVAWPVPVRRLTLVGHSMGGLVIRAACSVAEEGEAAWVPLARRIVYLGSPHLGAPLEVAATAATLALRRLPETRALGDALASRSVGIKDLRHGAVRAADHVDVPDLDAWRPEPTECPPLLASAEHYYIGATIGRRHDTVAARVIGDALVPWASASGTGRRRRLALDVDRGRHLAGLHHFDLLNHPRVYAVLREWLAD